MAGSAYDDYLAKVVSAEDAVLLNEALTCVRHGARRAAYIMVWLSAAESFKRKFRTLRTQDSRAQRIVADLEQKEEKHQAIDVSVLTNAKDYGLLSESEFTRLKHVYEMRCLYGHPYEEQPTPEALAAALADVVDIVLSRPPKLRHRFIQDQIELLTGNPAFLDDQCEPVQEYAREVYRKVDEQLHVYLIESLWKRVESFLNDQSMARYWRRCVWFSQAYLSVTDPPFPFAGWDVPQPLVQWPGIASICFSHASLWPLLGVHARDIVVGELIVRGGDRSAYLNALGQLYEADALTQRHKERFAQAIEETTPAYLVQSGIHLKHYASLVIQKLKSHNWHTQNPAIDALENAGAEQMAELPAHVQQELGNNVLQAADGGAFSARKLIDTIAQGAGQWPKEFVFGIVNECFINDDHEVRYKDGYLGPAMGCLNSLDPTDAHEIISKVASNIQKGDTTCVEGRARKRAEVVDFLRVREQQLDIPLTDLIDCLEQLALGDGRDV